MRIGRLDRRIELRHRALGSQDSNGAYSPVTYTEYATVWARKEEVSGREYFAAQTKQAENVVRFTIRYRDDVLATDRFECEDLDYDILQTSEGGRRESLTIFARAVVS